MDKPQFELARVVTTFALIALASVSVDGCGSAGRTLARGCGGAVQRSIAKSPGSVARRAGTLERLPPDRLALLGDVSSGRLAKLGVEIEGVMLYDASGHLIPGTAIEEALARIRARQAFEDALNEVSWDALGSEDELRTALIKTLARNGSQRYTFDVATGKLKFKLQAKDGEITAEVDAYSTAKKIASAAIAGGGGYLMLRRLLADSPGVRVDSMGAAQ